LVTLAVCFEWLFLFPADRQAIALRGLFSLFFESLFSLIQLVRHHCPSFLAPFVILSSLHHKPGAIGESFPPRGPFPSRRPLVFLHRLRPLSYLSAFAPTGHASPLQEAFLQSTSVFPLWNPLSLTFFFSPAVCQTCFSFGASGCPRPFESVTVDVLGLWGSPFHLNHHDPRGLVLPLFRFPSPCAFKVVFAPPLLIFPQNFLAHFQQSPHRVRSSLP